MPRSLRDHGRRAKLAAVVFLACLIASCAKSSKSSNPPPTEVSPDSDQTQNSGNQTDSACPFKFTTDTSATATTDLTDLSKQWQLKSSLFDKNEYEGAKAYTNDGLAFDFEAKQYKSLLFWYHEATDENHFEVTTSDKSSFTFDSYLFSAPVSVKGYENFRILVMLKPSKTAFGQFACIATAIRFDKDRQLQITGMQYLTAAGKDSAVSAADYFKDFSSSIRTYK